MPSSPNSYYFPTHPVHLFLNASTLGIQQSSRHPHFKKYNLIHGRKQRWTFPQTTEWISHTKFLSVRSTRYIRNRLHNLYIFVNNSPCALGASRSTKLTQSAMRARVTYLWVHSQYVTDEDVNQGPLTSRLLLHYFIPGNWLLVGKAKLPGMKSSRAKWWGRTWILELTCLHYWQYVQNGWLMRTYYIAQESRLSALWWPNWEGNSKKEWIYVYV